MTGPDEQTEETPWVSLRVIRQTDRGVYGYVYSHETRCHGVIIAVLPYRDTPDGRQWLVTNSITPCWSMDPIPSAVTGGWEGGSFRDDAVRELREETGYTVTTDDLVDLGESYASKSADNVYVLFTVDLTGREQGHIVGDGSRLEAEATTIWLTSTELVTVPDPQTALMFIRATAILENRAEVVG